MLQVVDKSGADPNSARREWMGLLARAPRELLEAWAQAAKPPGFSWLRRPESGLAMVRARAGGSGEKFNLGEMTVTRCALRLQGGASGVAYVQGRDHRKAELAALADALLQTKGAAERVKAELLGPLRGAPRGARRQHAAQGAGDPRRVLHRSRARRGNEPVDLAGVEPGFADLALESQGVFRSALDALSRPGRIVECRRAGDLRSPLALLDQDTRLWLSPSRAGARR